MGSTRTPSRVELVHLRLHGAAAEGAASAVRALLAPGPAGLRLVARTCRSPTTRSSRELAGRADRLIAEAGHADGALGVDALARAVSDRGTGGHRPRLGRADPVAAAAQPAHRRREHLEHMREGATVTIRHSADGAEPRRPPAGGVVARQHRTGDHDDVRLGPAPAAIRASARSGSPTPPGASSRSTASPAARAAAVVTRTPDGRTHDRMMPMPEPTPRPAAGGRARAPAPRPPVRARPA